mmetsp:Transcript_2254/g.5059  ORF Transcript_2254/g.5059 Transcript_2254/m.5059 type:complete len:392 (+) Transcript_2254:89-1264(+)|eukprot:CAMPEP_0202902282 /NCGR_PEP_ID=MMETSP1392-20130828/16757_1 /ASSEMBLY_ACC=CAM_ASM_000868 /TAXON_ID=225041 /ORGANISM="Chlamydomonas chlamydogama, Strain SAG 11-48b" /LENGTH=391 /DNA_ID=CAMNT_0049589023 /DNA_START=85 /DNA_END=1260 /DNA_ORIENTATION=-
MSIALDAALDEAGKVIKKQKTCDSKVSVCIDQLIDAVSNARASLLADPNLSTEVAMQQLSKKLDEMGVMKEMNSQVKDLHSSVNKLSKALDRTFDSQLDICKALRDAPMDEATINQVIAEHFYREGRFEIGDVFAREAGIPHADALKQPYIAMHEILSQIKSGQLDSALQWAVDNQAKLSSDGPSAFEFKLHSLNFIRILKHQGQQSALMYSKKHFQRFQKRHMRHIQRLMGCMLYYGKPLGECMYGDLLRPSAWEEVAQEFAKQACSLLGQAYESPLAVCVAAGAAALPALLKLAAVMERSSQDLRACEQVPIDLELGPEFVFHSIFACPVSREQSSSLNPPMLLPCNHVLCEQSVLKIAKSRTRIFKCPYCPMEARADNLRQLVFPDVE